MTTVVLLLAIAIHPADRFLASFAGSSGMRSADGRHLVHASGFLAETGERDPERSARAFLAGFGTAFGGPAEQALMVESAVPAGEAGAVRFRRTVAGLPVFGGDLVVGVDAQGRVLLVNTGPIASKTSGRHAVGEELAQRNAMRFAVRAAGPARVAAGWRSFAGSLRAVYRVEFVAQQPPGDWRV